MASHTDPLLQCASFEVGADGFPHTTLLILESGRFAVVSRRDAAAAAIPVWRPVLHEHATGPAMWKAGDAGAERGGDGGGEGDPADAES